MIIRIDLAAGATVVEPDQLTAFHAVCPTTDADAAGSAMGDAGHAAGEGHVWVSADWVRREVAGQVDDGWHEAFDAMVAYAASKGWMNDEGTHIKAHLESA